MEGTTDIGVAAVVAAIDMEPRGRPQASLVEAKGSCACCRGRGGSCGVGASGIGEGAAEWIGRCPPMYCWARREICVHVCVHCEV